MPVLLILLPTLALAVQPDRISGAVDPNEMVILQNHVSPMAQPQFDQGPVEPSRMLYITMLFTPTLQQQQALDKLLADQQDSASPSFHRWLTPEQYGKRFGLSQGDIDKISAWLQASGFKITYVARGRDFLSFTGNAAQVQSVFKTEVHYFNVNGKMHFANPTSPMIPAALSGIVGGFRGLHDFLPHPMIRPRPDYTVSGQSTHFLAPGDIATIYDINPLYKLSPAIDGKGQNVVIVGQSDVYLADLNDFRSAFGFSTFSGCSTNASGVITAGACSSRNFQMVVPGTGSDPGVVAGDLSESDLDIEWLGSVARNAQIIFVTSSGGVDDSASWAIDNNLAHVISYSYGLCEAFVTAPPIATTFEPEYQKAASLGISFFAASGDSGAAICDADNSNSTGPAVLGLSVSYPASSPNITGVGGTEFNEGTGSFWNTSNGPDGGSATGYIPELAWNDSVLAKEFDATGGGPSNCAFGSGTRTVGGFSFELCNAPPNGGFPKPTWQSGITPNDSVRDVPDIAFSASNVNDAYIVCTPQSEVVGNTSSTSTCATSVTDALTQFNPPSAFGGTSAATPVAAGMTVLLNQFLGTKGLGSINQQLYTVIFKNSPSVFHDIVTGTSSTTGDTSNNIVPCTKGTPSFEPAALQCPSGGTMGYSAGTGYDLVPGLGSLDIDAFFQAWAATVESFTLAANPATLSVQPGQTTANSVDLTVADPKNTGFIVNNQTKLPLTYTCTVSPAASEGPTCMFSPSSGQNVTVTNPTVAIVTIVPTAKLLRPLERPTRIFYAMLLPGALGIVLVSSGLGKKGLPARALRLLGLIMVLSSSTLWLGACGGSSTSAQSNPGTPAGNYTVTVNATTGGSSPIMNSTSFTVTVK